MKPVIKSRPMSTQELINNLNSSGNVQHKDIDTKGIAHQDLSMPSLSHSQTEERPAEQDPHKPVAVYKQMKDLLQLYEADSVITHRKPGQE